eukprot:4161729-Heterocapsa_arctica.AAC.1
MAAVRRWGAAQRRPRAARRTLLAKLRQRCWTEKGLCRTSWTTASGCPWPRCPRRSPGWPRGC